ncbi:MAG: hypothetical protein ACLRM9_09550 [Collinsella aerofaciens]
MVEHDAGIEQVDALTKAEVETMQRDFRLGFLNTAAIRRASPAL